MTEQEVRRYLRQMKEEDSERAFHSFYNLCYDRLFRIACYFVKHEEWAQEIVLDVFMKLWEQRALLPEVNNIEDYCFILTKNASSITWKKENPAPYTLVRTASRSFRPGRFPRRHSISEELFARYVKALDRLPERCREVFIRLREEKQSYAQVAEELNISTKTVDAQLQKALTRLKEALLTE